jgi:hypothetical protein
MNLPEWLKYKPTEDIEEDKLDGQLAGKNTKLFVIGGIMLLTVLYQFTTHAIAFSLIAWYYLAAALLAYVFAQKTIGRYERDIHLDQIHYYKKQKSHKLVYAFIVPVIHNFLYDYIFRHYPISRTIFPIPIWIYFILPIYFFYELFVYLWVVRYEKAHGVTLTFCNDYYREQEAKS